MNRKEGIFFYIFDETKNYKTQIQVTIRIELGRKNPIKSSFYIKIGDEIVFFE